MYTNICKVPYAVRKVVDDIEKFFKTRRRYFKEMHATAVEAWSPSKQIWLHVRWEQGNSTY